MNTAIEQLPWPEIEVVTALLLNWLVTQAWKAVVPSKPVNPLLISSCVGAIIGAIILGIQGRETPAQIFWAVFVAVVSVFGASGIHWFRSVRRAVKTRATL